MIVVIDDERTFSGHVDYYLRNSNDALGFLARNLLEYLSSYGEPIDELWLDHDLGGIDDIRIVVDFLLLVVKPMWIRHIYVHSQNPTTYWIVTSLKSTGYNVARSPLPELSERVSE